LTEHDVKNRIGPLKASIDPDQGLLERIRKDHGKTEFRVTPALGEAPEIVAAISDWVQRKAS
jgi:hypothetical protein